MRFIYELSDWPNFFWDEHQLSTVLAEVRHRQGKLLGHMEAFGFSDRDESNLKNLTVDVIKSSDIEGETLEEDQVRSSLARRLGMDIAGLVPSDRNVDGIVEMMLDTTQNFAKPLTKERLFAWHASLFPTGRSGMTKIIVGAWRDDQSGDMQVVSSVLGRERIHFQAPHARELEREMARFINWFNSEDDLDPVIKAAIAHLWFVTIHPFEDGNGRIARAISDMQLAKSEKCEQRFYSMSAQIRNERKNYYNILESTQKSSSLDITAWLTWNLSCLNLALADAELSIEEILKKVRFWQTHSETLLNDRQRLMLNKLLHQFEGKLTSSKWAKIAKTSQDTALRDITDLVERGILVKDLGSGRSTSYSLSNF